MRGYLMRTIRADEYCKFVTDGTHDSPKQVDKGRKLITSKHLGRYGINFEGAKNISELDYQKVISRSKVEQWDILFSTIGNLYLERNHKIEYACKNMGIFQLGGDESKAKWLYYYLQTPKAKEYIETSGRGTTQSYVPLAALRALPVDVVDDFTRDKIIKILWDIDEKILTNQQVNENLLQQALAIYKAWFCDFVLSDGVLPESWHITTIDALSSLVTRGIAPKYDNSSNQIVLNQKCIRDHTIDVSLARRHLPKKINEKWVSKGDLLINSTGTGTLGRVAQVWFDANNMTVDSHVTIVRPKAPILQSYIGFWGLSHESEIEAQHTGSTGQTELPRDRVKAMELPLPDEDTLSKFNELVIPMTDAVVSNQKENAQLSQLRDTLLPKLMSGEIDVAELEL